MWVVDVVVDVVGIDDDGVGRPFCPKGASGIYEQKILDRVEEWGEARRRGKHEIQID